MDCPFKVGDVVDYNQLATDWMREEIGLGPFVLTNVQNVEHLGLQVSLRDFSGRNVCGRHSRKPRFISVAYFRHRS